MMRRASWVFLACAPLLTQCAKPAAEPQRAVERGMEIAATFESTEPYSDRKVTAANFEKFFEKHPEYRSDSASIAGFYQARDMQFAWMPGDSLSASAEAFIAFAGADDSAATHNKEFGAHLTELYEQSSMGESAAVCDGCALDLELHLTAEFFHFANRGYGGFLTRDMRDLNWYIPRAKKDPRRLIDSLATGKLDLADYQPLHPQYEKLRGGIQQYQKLSAEPWPALELPARRKALKAGDSSSVIRDVRVRLHALGDLTDTVGGVQYDSALAAGVRGFQARHGFKTDGIIDAPLLRSLNVPVSQRLLTMLVNIERLRWAPEQLPPNALAVNIPEYRLHIYENGQVVNSMDVVVGTRATRTVIFSDTLSRIVFSPSWTVPPGITRNEVIPGMQKDRDYLAKHDMEKIGGTDEAPIVRQKPGPRNPLGGVKFLFPNVYDIYMHDTPTRGTFNLEQRTASHGCIRVSRATELAEYLLRNDPEWPADRIRAAMASGEETTVNLSDKRPVTIGYFTAWVDADGRVNFRDDVYGHDAKLAGELFAR
jgi:murein L,D-transpeptidase YcbB/YkuD